MKFFIILAGLTLTLYGKSSFANEACKQLDKSYNNHDITSIVYFDRYAKPSIHEQCQLEMGKHFPYKKQRYFFTCNALQNLVYLGNLPTIRVFESIATKKEQIACMHFALQQWSTGGGDEQFEAFTHTLRQLTGLQSYNDTELFTDLLIEYAIPYLNWDSRYAAHLLALGADPTASNKKGESPLSNALWVANINGSCDVAHLLIKQMKPSDFSILYKRAIVENLNGDITPLNEAETITPFCEKERSLLANKAKQALSAP